MRDNRVMRVVTEEQEDENDEQNNQEKRRFSLQERVDHLTRQLRPERMKEKEWEEEKKCEEMK